MMALILSLTVGKQEKDLSAVLTILVCVIAGIAALTFLEPVIDLLKELEHLGALQNGMLGILLKVAGIALVSEISCLICSDAGSSSMGRILQFMGSALILYLSVPLLRTLLSVLSDILGEL